MFTIKKDPTKVILLGSGKGNELAPKESSKMIYALNDYVYTEKTGIIPDKLFIMDVLDEKPMVVAGISNLQDVVNRINKLKVPLIAPYKYEEIPLSEEFPLERCVKEFGIPYFSNTISYMIAYALLEGIKEIDIYGINQASSSEYFYEKAGVEYWLGIAVGRGVKITINGASSELLTNKARFGGGILYGYNMTYNHFKEAKQRFGGEVIIKKLLEPSRTQPSLHTRVINP